MTNTGVTNDQDRQLDALQKRVRELERWFETQDQHIRYLERERQKLSALVNHTDAGFLVVDAQKRLVWANLIFNERFATDDPGTGAGRHLCRVLCCNAGGCACCPVDEVLASGRVAHHECRHEADGQSRHLYSTVMPIRTPEGTIDEIMIMIQDITDLEVLRRSHEEMLASKNAAEAANHAKSDFLASMSHEIRTPLNGVIGMNNLLLESSLSGEQREWVETAQSSAESLLGVINDVLDLSKIEAGKMELEQIDFSLATTLDAAVRPVALQARQKQLFLKREIAPGTPDAWRGDPGRLRQILLNLVGNAVKFTERGGVAVRAEVVRADGERGVLRLSITDTGLGIDPGRAAALFEPFAQADGSTTRRFGGTGLGLAIVKRLAAAMGGEVGATGEPGRGSTFWVTVDLPRAAVVAAGPTSPATDLPAAPPSHVLLAEDNEVNQFIARRMLEKLGHRVTTAGDGRQALAVLAREAVDIVLMDVQMPQLDGIEATRLIRAGEAGGRAAAVPIIGLSAHALQADADRCIAAGMNAYLTKPVRPPELAAALARHLAAVPC